MSTEPSPERTRIYSEIAAIERDRAALERREALAWQDFRQWSRSMTSREYQVEHEHLVTHRKDEIVFMQAAEEAAREQEKGHATVHVHDRTDMPRKLSDNTTYVLHCEVGPLELPLEGRIDHLEIKVRS